MCIDVMGSSPPTFKGNRFHDDDRIRNFQISGKKQAEYEYISFLSSAKTLRLNHTHTKQTNVFSYYCVRYPGSFRNYSLVHIVWLLFVKAIGPYTTWKGAVLPDIRNVNFEIKIYFWWVIRGLPIFLLKLFSKLSYLKVC